MAGDLKEPWNTLSIISVLPIAFIMMIILFIGFVFIVIGNLIKRIFIARNV